MNNEAHCSTSIQYYHISRKRCRKYNFSEVLDPSPVLHCTTQALKVGDIVPTHLPVTLSMSVSSPSAVRGGAPTA